MKTVLLVDDEASLRILVRTTLEDSRCRVLEAHDGRMALSIVRRESPDLILLDWMMPGMSGLDFVEVLRKDAATARIPVIMLTARGQEKDREQALLAGCEHFLVKPFSPLELLSLVRSVLERKSASPKHEAVEGVSPETLARLEKVDPQLALYVRDLRRVVEQEQARSKELADANARLGQVSKCKTEFIAYVSQGLRAPLAAIDAVRPALPGARVEDAELAGIVRTSYDRLNEFVEKGLEYFARAGDGASGTDTTDLSAVVASAVAALRRSPHGSRARVEVAGTEAPVLVRAEAPALANVVSIMLENAVEHGGGSEPDVEIDVRVLGEHAILSVIDHGVGVATERLAELFDPFAGSAVASKPRAGVDLALARVIVEAAGGAIRAQSEGHGHGTTFTVELPLAAGAATTGARPPRGARSSNGG